VWQKAMELARDIYRITKKMPEDERFGLTNQMRRAAVSVPSNIAEGYGRHGRMDYIRFLKMARGSLAELMTQYELATSMQMISDDITVNRLLKDTETLLQSLITSLERPKND
jgi:four helix bundle protein